MLTHKKQQDEIGQVEEAVVKHRTPYAVCFTVEPALGESEEE